MTPSRDSAKTIFPWRCKTEMLELVKLEAKKKHMHVSEFIDYVMTRYFEDDLPTMDEIRKAKKKPWYLQ